MASIHDTTFPTSADAGALHVPGAGAVPPGADAAQAAPDVLGRVVQGAHDTIDRLAETAAPHVQRLQEGMSSAGEQMHDRADQVTQMSEEWAESLRCTVRDHPIAAVTAALALGVLIARLTHR